MNDIMNSTQNNSPFVTNPCECFFSGVGQNLSDNAKNLNSIYDVGKKIIESSEFTPEQKIYVFNKMCDKDTEDKQFRANAINEEEKVATGVVVAAAVVGVAAVATNFILSLPNDNDNTNSDYCNAFI